MTKTTVCGVHTPFSCRYTPHTLLLGTHVWQHREMLVYFLALAACSALTSTPREGTKLAKGVSTISWGEGGGGGGGGIQEREGLRDGKGRRKKERRERQGEEE